MNASHTINDRYAKIINQVVEQVKLEVTPLQIILFGSIARNEAKSDSDIDLLVVMPDGTHRRKTAHTLYKIIRKIDAPLDILVATPKDLEEHRHNPGLIYRHILQEGIGVYGT